MGDSKHGRVGYSFLEDRLKLNMLSSQENSKWIILTDLKGIIDFSVKSAKSLVFWELKDIFHKNISPPLLRASYIDFFFSKAVLKFTGSLEVTWNKRGSNLTVLTLSSQPYLSKSQIHHLIFFSFLFFFFFFSRQGLSVCHWLFWNSVLRPRLASNSEKSSCLCYLGAGIKDVHHQLLFGSSYIREMFLELT